MIKTLIFLISVYVGVGMILFFAQRTFIYFPTPALKHQYTEISYDFDDAKIRVVAINRENEKAILYFGGNGEAVEYTAPALEKMFPKHAVYLVKYRGYGGSTGKPSEKKIYLDALRIFDHLAKEYSYISVIGRSLGSGVATYISANRKVENLALITPYDSIESIAQKSYPVFPISLLLRDKYNSAGRADSITANTLLLVAENDNIIKKLHSDRLYQSFTHQTPKLVVIKNTGHNNISESKQYHEELIRFMGSASD